MREKNSLVAEIRNKKIIWLKNPYMIIILLVLISGIFLYAPFIFGEYTFAYKDWGYDTKHSYLPTYEFYANKLQDLRLSTYDFSYGLGTSIFATTSYVGDIFSLIVIVGGGLFGPQNVGLYIVFMQLAKHIVLGIFGLYYLKLFGFSNKASIVASYVLAYCGYMLVTGQHFLFSAYAVTFCFCLIMIEKTIRDNKQHILGLAIAVALQGVNSPYATFQTLIALGIYSIIRIWQLNDLKKEWKTWLKILGKLFTGVVLGILLAMFSFLPQVYEIMYVSKRIDSNANIFEFVKNAFSLTSVDNLKSSFFRLFSNNLEGLINEWKGSAPFFATTPYFFSIFFPVCIAQKVCHTFKIEKMSKEKGINIVILILFAFIVFFNFIPLLSNVFMYIQYRYVFTLLPFFALLLAENLDDIWRKREYNCFLSVIMCILCSVLLVLNTSSENKYCKLSLSVSIVLLVIAVISSIIIYKSKTKKYLIEGLFLFAIIFSINFDAAIGLYAERDIMTKEEYKTDYRMGYLQHFSELIESIEGDKFVRCDRTFVGYDGSPDIMIAGIVPNRTVSVYNSAMSKYINIFMKEIIGIDIGIQMGYSLNSYGTQFDPVMASILGLKYIVSDKYRELQEWKIISEYDGIYLYQNQNINTAGLIYDKYLEEEEYEKLSLCEKKILLDVAVILDEDLDDFESDIDMTYINYNDLVSISIEKDSELVCSTDGTYNIIGNAKEKEQVKIDIGDITGSERECMYLNFNMQSTMPGQIMIYSLDANNEIVDQVNISYQGGEEEKVVQITSDVEQLVIECFATELRMEDLQVNVYSSAKKEENYDVTFTNSKMGNVVEGTINLETEKILFMPIVYDDNWKVYVNGKDVKVMKADYGFMAIKLERGKNNIQFIYNNRFFYIGIFLSMVGIFLAVIIYWIESRKRKIK